MSHRETERRFWFRGNAAAFGGRITSPVCETLDTEASAVLPPTGGFASAAAGPFHHRNIVSFERATSMVAGRLSEQDGDTAGETLVTVAVERLNVLDMVTADRVVARLTSRHSAKEGAEPEMLPVGSYFENLRIAGILIEPTPRRELLDQGGYSNLAGSRPARSTDAGAEQSETGTDVDRRSRPMQSGPLFDDQFLLTSLFDSEEISGRVSGRCKVTGGNGIHIPEFGTIYLGEYLVSRHSRRLTMLRIELGCPVEGTIVCANGDGNGHWDP